MAIKNILIIIFIILTPIAFAQEDNPNLIAKKAAENVNESNEEYLEAILNAAIVELQLKENKVWIVTKDLFIKNEWAPKNGRLLDVGDTFSGPPSTDDSFSAKYVIKKIEEDGVLIEYESITDETPWGGKVIIDKGEIKLKWKG